MSSLVAGFFAHWYGRRAALWTACVLNAVACIIQIATENKGAVYVGRLILGFANGFLVTFSNVYTSEASPAHLRAVMVALFAYWVNIGSIVGAAITNATKSRLDKASYQIPIGTLFIVPVFLAVGLFFVPESPRWLLNKVALEYIELEWMEMVKGIEEEKRLATTVGVLDMFKSEPADPPFRAQELISVDTDLRRTLLCYGMIACQTASGIWFLISYATYFMIVGGLTVDEAFKFSVMNTCIGFIGVNCGMFAMRHLVGRRSILMGGAAFCGLCMLALAIAASVATSPVVLRDCLIAFTALFFFGYNSCVGAASYPVATELGAKYGYIWAAANFLCVGFFFLCMPELKGRSLEEIDELFLNKVSVRNFPKYQTTIGDEAAREVKENTGLFDHKSGAGTEHVEQVK
ncbi:General substrate transporter [Neofusicoccum parvum]|nr:General substrate transporter [Neofusicoccum parvum]